jgi:hypothetical protein
MRGHQITLGILAIVSGIAAAVLAEPVVFRSFAAPQCSNAADYHQLASWAFAAMSIATVALGAAAVLRGIRGRNLAGAGIGVVALGMFVIVTMPLSAVIVDRSAASPGVFPIRTIHTAQIAYRSSTGKYGTIDDLVRSGLLDAGYAKQVQGYTYQIENDASNYVVRASPLATRPGCFEYYSSSDAVVYYSKDPKKAPPNRSGLPLQ